MCPRKELAVFSNVLIRLPATMSSAIVVLAVLMWACDGAQSLTCYETNVEGHHVEKTDPSWKYCAYTPKIVPGKGLVVDAAFGLAEENDMLAGYDFMFSANDHSYQVLDTCIHESFEFRGRSAKFALVEHSFRCVCNSNLCNHGTLFGGLFSDA